MLTEVEALRAYARMLNTSQISALAPLLADDFVYESQMVISPLESKQEFLSYMEAKLATIRASHATVYAQMGTVAAFFRECPCVVVAQRDLNQLMCLVLAKTEGDLLKRLDLCVVPSPREANRTGDYPT